MNGRDKLSIIPFTFFFLLGLYAVIKFFLVVFWTLNFNTKIMLELTPFFLFKMNPVQLFILSAVVAGSDAYFHFQNHGKNIVISFIPTALMLFGIGAAIYVSEWNNPFYYALFAIMLGVTVVDHRYLLHVNGYLREEKEEAAVEEVEGIAERERRLEEKMRALKEAIGKAEPVPEIEVEEEAPEEEEELEELLEAEKIEEELEEMPEEERAKMEELPEVPPELIEKTERKEEMKLPAEKVVKEIPVIKPKPVEKELPKEEREKSVEELLEELLETVEEKKEKEGKECPVCGAMNPPDAKYCKECGSELEEEE